MLDINISDVLNIVKLCVPYLIFLGVVVVVALLAMVLVRKLSKAKKYMIRWQAGVAMLLALIITVNLILVGPLSNIVTLAMGGGTIDEETTVEAQNLVEEIANEGVVLLENKDSLLPLTQDSNLNVFGWASTNPCYGGTGSGALSDAYPIVSLIEGLENSGFALNKDLESFYTTFASERPEVGMFAQDWTLPEPTVDSYSDELLSGAKEFSDKAMIVITRVGGEGADVPTDVSAVTFNNNSEEYDEFAAGEHYLQLSQSEKNMVEMVCENFEDVILVYNGANTFELDFVNDYSQIKSVIWCPGTGQTGFNSLGSILKGEVNPSAKTPDIFVKDLTTAPYYNNIGNFTYENMDEFKTEAFGVPTLPTFVNYVEGIYVGYRFYETASDEGAIDYDAEISYPFGYGLSYTTFSQDMSDLSVDADGNISVNVAVTNTGDVAGKEVVQVYYNPPYTNGGIEKATANLVAFDKTDVIEPGETQEMTITFTAEEMASYDYAGEGSYVLEAGDYAISIREDSHTVIEEENYTVDETIVYDEENARSTDETVAVNQFDSAAGDVVYLSRENGFENYEEATADPANFEMSEENKATFMNNSNFDPADFNDESDEMPTTGASNGVVLEDMRGLDYDDPAWETLLDQLTVDEMSELIALGGYQTVAAKSVGKFSTVDCDGPASINNNFTGVGSIGFPSAVMIACSWNTDLAYQFGESIGKMADEMGVSGWYAPAMNIHRSAFAGRNFEYYSEDGVLSGQMAANAVLGAEEHGVYAYIKHFAMNDQENNRLSMICTWSTEQAMREIYLKPFEIAVKQGGAKAVMSSFNYIGNEWAGASDELLNTVLRDEWGFHGMVLTDYYGVYGYMDADNAIRNGNDICLTNYDAGTNYVSDKTSATSVIAMRQASKNIMYTVVNSRAYSEEALAQAGKMAPWKIIMICVDVVLVALLGVLEVMVIAKGYKKRKAEVVEEIEEIDSHENE